MYTDLLLGVLKKYVLLSPRIPLLTGRVLKDTPETTILTTYSIFGYSGRYCFSRLLYLWEQLK